LNLIKGNQTEPAQRLLGLSSMKLKLEALYLNSTVLLPEALTDTPCRVGSLVIEDWPQGGPFGRVICQARFLEMTSPTTLRDIVPPLFEPQIVTMKDNQMTVHGYQIHVDTETGAIRHHVRSWVLRAVTAE
jgi:hypothetical protein